MAEHECKICGYKFGFMASGFGGECKLCHGNVCKEHFLKKKEVCTACAIKFDIKEE